MVLQKIITWELALLQTMAPEARNHGALVRKPQISHDHHKYTQKSSKRRLDNLTHQTLMHIPPYMPSIYKSTIHKTRGLCLCFQPVAAQGPICPFLSEVALCGRCRQPHGFPAPPDKLLRELAAVTRTHLNMTVFQPLNTGKKDQKHHSSSFHVPTFCSSRFRDWGWALTRPCMGLRTKWLGISRRGCLWPARVCLEVHGKLQARLQVQPEAVEVYNNLIVNPTITTVYDLPACEKP